jgi:hypothetical protein
MRWIPVYPISVRECSVVHGKIRAGKIDSFHLCVIIIQYLQELVLEILFSQQKKDKPGVFIHLVIHMDDSRAVVEPDLNILYGNITVTVLVRRQNRSRDTYRNED